MSSTVAFSTNQVAVISRTFPCISILMPFEPKMSSKAELQNKIDSVFALAKSELLLRFPKERCEDMSRRLNRILSRLDYLTHKRSIAIFLSTSVDRIYYLDLSIKMKVVVGNPFHLTDLVRNKVQHEEFLVLALHEKWARIYEGRPGKFVRLVSNVAEYIYDDRAGSWPGIDAAQKLSRFLQYTDDNLSILLQSYPLPLFVIGTQKIIGQFRKVSTNKTNVVTYISSNVENAPESKIQALVLPHVANWKLVKEHFLFNQMHDAEKKGKLARGIGEVWREANRRNGKLLMIENGYMNDGVDGNKVRAIFRSTKENPFCIADEIDQLIEKVLQSGGDVEFVEDGSLDDYQRIALIKEY